MIPIPFEHAFTIYLILFLSILTILWFFQEQHKKKISSWSIVRDRLYVCDKCHLTFLAKNDSEHVTRCPRCNEMCFIRRRKHY